MPFTVVGLSHRTAPVEIREKLTLTRDQVMSVAGEIRQRGDLDEWIILSTCNRTEVLAVAREGLGREGCFKTVLALLSGFQGDDPGSLERYLYAYHGVDAARHMFRVASSLDSMVIGEPQILGQVKEAYALAIQSGSIGPCLDPLVQRALSVAKRVRTTTGIARNPVSISQAASELAHRIFGDLKGRSVLILGSGKMAELAARHMKEKGVREAYVTSRAFHRAQETAKRVGGLPITFDRMHDHLPGVDIVIASTAAPHYVLMKEDGRRLMRERKGRPIFFIDIAVPRDIDPALNTFDNLYLYDIDDLQQSVDSGLEERRSEALTAERIVEEEVARYTLHIRSRDAAPSIIDLRQKLLSMAVSEMRRHRGRLGPLSEQQEEVIREMMGSLVKKILHGPTRELKRLAGRSDRRELFDLVRRMWDLGLEEEEESNPGRGKP